ncbi:hypothetical protein G6O67_007563 [Ophiocordyceps sinensis]|uniref:Uncharacterized protein n=1 Tax=Ophiocordyceps sinensis TaxID=72228 RepID=A0A8H4LU23_9HYPO|nr:hypothetical protein G6O67_007563 [Ophiocordyceps sinensis]
MIIAIHATLSPMSLQIDYGNRLSRRIGHSMSEDAPRLDMTAAPASASPPSSSRPPASVAGASDLQVCSNKLKLEKKNVEAAKIVATFHGGDGNRKEHLTVAFSDKTGNVVSVHHVRGPRDVKPLKWKPTKKKQKPTKNQPKK